MKSLLIVFSLFTSLYVSAQFAGIDSMRANIYAATNDKEQLLHLMAISKRINSLHTDSIYKYALMTKNLATKLGDKKSQALAEYSFIAGDLVKGKTDSVVYKIDHTALFKDIKSRDTALYYRLQFLKANALNRLNKRTDALDLQLKLLNDAEKEGNIQAQLYALNYIGATYLNVNKFLDARQTWYKGLDIISQQNDVANEEIEAFILSNIALYHFKNIFINSSKAISDSFLFSINKTIALASKNSTMGVLASAYALRGNYYGYTKQFEAGETDFKAGISIRQQIGDPLYIINDLIGLSEFYLRQKNYNECIETCMQGLDVSNKSSIKGREKLQLIYLIASAYKNMGNYQQYSTALEKYILELNTHTEMNAAEKIAEIQTKYEVQKKETLIAQQKLELLQRKIFLYGGGLLMLLLSLFFVFRFRQYKAQQKRILHEKKLQHEAALKTAEEKERKRIAAELHDNLGVQANAILHSSSLLNHGSTADKTIVTDLQDTAKEMLQNLRETLWAMKSTDVQATDLWLRIINFMKQMGRHYGHIHFKVEGAAPPGVVVPSNKALNIVLIVQEAISNAVKHAQATTITASSLPSENNTWNLVVQDNGKGMTTTVDTVEPTERYGMENMQDRATASGIGLAIESAADNGTKVTLMM
jgi:signal transduction histidine kinase